MPFGMKFLDFVSTSVAEGGHSANFSRSQWPSGLRRGSAAGRLLGLRARIPPGAWVFVLCVVSKGNTQDIEDKGTGTDEVHTKYTRIRTIPVGARFSTPVLIQWVSGLFSGG
jgi:hypothetical protein